MSELQTIEFDFRPLYPGAVPIVPAVDARSLADLAHEFESSAGYKPAGRYVPEHQYRLAAGAASQRGT